MMTSELLKLFIQSWMFLQTENLIREECEMETVDIILDLKWQLK